MFQKMFMLMLLLQLLDVGNVEVQRGQNCLQVICEAGPAIKQVVSRVDGGNTVSKLLIYTTVQSDFGDVTLANEEALEQSSLARGGVT